MAQTTRTPRSAARGAGTRRAPTGRFARASATRTGRSARSTRSTAGAQSRVPRLRARKPPQKTGLARVAGLLPTGSKATPSSKTGRIGGVAALAAAAGVAFRNRDKLTGRLKRNSGHDEDQLGSPTPPIPPPHTT
jgi:hypothetical protein